MTFKELKDTLNALENFVLDIPIIVTTEMGAIQIDSLWIAAEDQINPSGDGMEPVSAYADDPKVLETEPVVLKKGSPILFGECYER